MSCNYCSIRLNSCLLLSRSWGNSTSFEWEENIHILLALKWITNVYFAKATFFCPVSTFLKKGDCNCFSTLVTCKKNYKGKCYYVHICTTGTSTIMQYLRWTGHIFFTEELNCVQFRLHLWQATMQTEARNPLANSQTYKYESAHTKLFVPWKGGEQSYCMFYLLCWAYRCGQTALHDS